MKFKIMLLAVLFTCTSVSVQAMKQSEFIAYCSDEQKEYQIDVAVGQATRVYEKQHQMMVVTTSSDTDYILRIMKNSFLDMGLREECAAYLYKNGALTIGDNEILARVNFAFDEYQLMGESRYILKGLAHNMKYSNSSLQLTGHADAIGQDVYNYELGIKRSESVKQYLIENDVNEQRIKLDSEGELHPEFNNDTEAGRERNRRVDIDFTRL